MTDTWRAYYPEDGETADDAREIKPRRTWQPPICDAEDAAQRACEIDFDERDGWERGMDSEFHIVVIAPDGTETRWTGSHVQSVDHRVEEAEDDDE